MPQIGEKVLVKAVYNPTQSVPWNALKVQTLSNQVPLACSLGIKDFFSSPPPGIQSLATSYVEPEALDLPKVQT